MSLKRTPESVIRQQSSSHSFWHQTGKDNISAARRALFSEKKAVLPFFMLIHKMEQQMKRIDAWLHLRISSPCITVNDNKLYERWCGRSPKVCGKWPKRVSTGAVKSWMKTSSSQLYESRTDVRPHAACQRVVIQFEISRATSKTHCTLTWQPWQSSATYICQPLSQGLRRLFCFMSARCGQTWHWIPALWNADEADACVCVFFFLCVCLCDSRNRLRRLRAHLHELCAGRKKNNR